MTAALVFAGLVVLLALQLIPLPPRVADWVFIGVVGLMIGAVLGQLSVTLAIDPGPVRSALVLYDAAPGLCAHHVGPNDWILAYLATYDAAPGDVLVIEQIASYGMAVGAEIFETCVWSGRFWQQWAHRGYRVERLTRQAVKLALTGQARAKDANIRQSLIDRFGGAQVIRKGGALYKVSGDAWAALAVAVVWTDAQPF